MRRIICLLILLCAPALGAQRIRGVVRDNGSNQPVAGAIVFALDSARLVLARTLTNARGEYDLPRATAIRQLRVMRLGFRPTEISVAASIDGTTRVDVKLVNVPFTLTEVKTVAANACPKRSDAKRALALLEEARTGLLATIVARESRPATVTRLDVTRSRGFENDDIKSMSVIMDSAATTNSYASAKPAAELVVDGFASDTVGVLTAYGPDAEVLLDEAFANAYCFRIMERETSRPTQIGLGFAPADSKRGRVDIEGAVWIDTAAKQLIDIEYLYRGFARAFDKGRPGGHIEFRGMPSGVTMIDRWALRLPSRENGPGVRRPEMVSNTSRLVIQESGGELADVRWDDGSQWHAHLGSAQLKLTTRGGDPDVNRAVRLDSTTYVGHTDSSGVVMFRDLVPGPYKVVLLDGRLEQLDVQIPTRTTFSAARDSTSIVEVGTRTLEEFVRDRCVAERNGIGPAMVFGRILNPDGTPASHVDIIIDRINDAGEMIRIASGGYTGSDGLFAWCAFERGWHVVITAKRNNLSRTVELPNKDEGVSVLQFQLRAKP